MWRKFRIATAVCEGEGEENSVQRKAYCHHRRQGLVWLSAQVLDPDRSREDLERHFKYFIMEFAAWNTLGSFVGIGWRAHLGGLAAGAVLAWATGHRLHLEPGLFCTKVVDKPLVDVRAPFRSKPLVDIDAVSRSNQQ